MSILRTKRTSGRTVYHEWDYSLQDSNVILAGDIEQVSLSPRGVEKIWLKANQSIGANDSEVNYFFNNYRIDTKGGLVNTDVLGEAGRKVATLRKDLYYINLEKLYDYQNRGKTYYAYYKQQYPVAGLVACNFVYNPNPNRFKYIEFLDGDRTNHNATNLAWVDKKSKKSLKILR